MTTLPRGRGLRSRPRVAEDIGSARRQSLQLDTLRLKFQQEQLRTRRTDRGQPGGIGCALARPGSLTTRWSPGWRGCSRSSRPGAGSETQHQMDVRELLTAEQRALWVQMSARGAGGRGRGLHGGGVGGFGMHQGGGHGGPGFGPHSCGGPCGERMARGERARLHRRHQHHMDAPAGPEPDVEEENEPF